MSLPATGKDTKLTITLDGALAKVVDKVTDFRVSDRTTAVSTKVLGESGSYEDDEFDGWEGTIEVAMDTASVDEMFDLIQSARVLGVPVIVNIVDTTTYRDFSKNSYSYPDVKLTYERQARRGDAQKCTLKWRTGSNRIQL